MKASQRSYKTSYVSTFDGIGLHVKVLYVTTIKLICHNNIWLARCGDFRHWKARMEDMTEKLSNLDDKGDRFGQHLDLSVGSTQKPGAPNDNFRENICSEDDLRSRIFGTFVVKFLACLPLLGFSNI